MKKNISKIGTKRARLQKRQDALWAQITSMPAGTDRNNKLKKFLKLNADAGILPTLDGLEEFGKFLDRQPIAMVMIKAANNGILPDDAWQKSYDEGYQYVIEFCNYDPSLPSPPAPEDDPQRGFKSLQRWHIQAVNPIGPNEDSAEGTRKKEKKQDKTATLEPLSYKAAAVLTLLENLPVGRALTGKKILGELDKQNIFIDQGTLTKRIIPALKPYGVKNKPRIGYYLDRCK
jgi:hypothetical protein